MAYVEAGILKHQHQKVTEAQVPEAIASRISIKKGASGPMPLQDQRRRQGEDHG